MKTDDDLLEKLRWRGIDDPESETHGYLRRPAYSAAAPPPLLRGAGEAAPCGIGGGSSSSQAPKEKLQTSSWRSTARPLSASGCVWLLENVCIDERTVILFGEGGPSGLPRRLLGCGEFGNYEFNAIEVRPPRARRAFPRNASDPRQPNTLLVVPGLISGVSPHNPFHLLHATVPVVWQLHHPSYGLCVPRQDLDVRLAFLSSWHASRQSHFWEVFTRHRTEPLTAKDEEQRFNLASQWRFWWGPLSDHPPMPLGVDPEPRCYRKIIFGRELFRTGIGGFVTPRVLAFYHNYLARVFVASEAHPRAPRVIGAEVPPSIDVEWDIFARMRPGTLRASKQTDVSALWELLGDRFGGKLYSEAGVERLSRSPLRLWRGQGTELSGESARFVGSTPAPADAALAGPASQELRVLAIQRPKGVGRWISNLEEAVQWIVAWGERRFLNVAVLVADFEHVHPAGQWQLARQAHILLGVTGAALAWAAFLPRGSVVLDLFPPGAGFCDMEGWDSNPASHYGGLARLAGVGHGCGAHPAELRGGGADAAHLARKEVREKLGGLWHGQDVRLDLPKFQQLFVEAANRVLSREEA